MGNRADQVDDALAGLESETASDLARTLSEYTVRDITAAVARRVLDAGEGGGGLPTGWTQDEADPANVDSNGGELDLGETTLTVGSLTLAGARTLQITSDDPSAGGGSPAPIGSLLLRTNGQAWLKTGALDTDWVQFGLADPGIKVVRVPFAWNTAGIVVTPGLTLYTPTVGDALLLDQSFMSITTAFDGTDTAYNLTYSDLASAFGSGSIVGLADLGAGDSVSTIPAVSNNGYGPLFTQSGFWIFQDTTPLVMILDNGSGSDPMMGAGAGEVVLSILPA